eukprot:scaffold130658_cov15-Tisochrysis_lutea.AAC.2
MGVPGGGAAPIGSSAGTVKSGGKVEWCVCDLHGAHTRACVCARAHVCVCMLACLCAPFTSSRVDRNSSGYNSTYPTFE